MQSAVPKQYLPLLNRPVLWRTLERLSAHARVQGVIVGIAANDSHWPNMAAEAACLPKYLGTSPGGATRAETVLNGLKALARHAHSEDWVLVHDAVRPCVRHEDIDRLIDAVIDGSDGGLLAFPIADTVKRVDTSGRITETVARSGLWRAATPQMFRLDRLTQALERGMKAETEITDEASAMELTGVRPKVVACHGDNIKITVPEDLALAELYLKQQGAR